MFRLWHIVVLIAIGAKITLTGWPMAQLTGLVMIGTGIGIGLGGMLGYKEDL